MNIKNILPYYIPCRVQVDGKEWGQLIGFSKHDEIEQYLWDILIDGDGDPLTLGMPYNDDFSDDCRVKPVLRPLDSMTEEEAKEFIRIQDTGKDFHQKAADKVIYSYDGNGDNGKIFGVMYFKWSDPNQFHYLLSRGFDLFGLIESGAAIDSNTLTQ